MTVQKSSVSFPFKNWRITTETLQLGVVLTDILICAAAMLSASATYSALAQGDVSASDGLIQGTIIGVPFVTFMALFHGYETVSLASPRLQTSAVFRSLVGTFFILAWSVFLLKTATQFSRGTITVFFLYATIGLSLSHWFLSLFLQKAFSKGLLQVRSAVLITGSQSSKIAQLIEKRMQNGIRIVSIERIAIEGKQKRSTKEFERILSRLRTQLLPGRVDLLLIDLPWEHRPSLEHLRERYLPLPIPIYLVPDTSLTQIIELRTASLGNLEVVELERAPLKRLESVVKRVFDLTIGCVALLLLAPVMLISLSCIWLETGRPLLFSQRRRGLGTRQFKIFKMRTMHVSEDTGVTRHASRGDPRVTRVGRLLRATSIDELPQIFNVIRGDMSLVGPRPHAVDHDDSYALQIEAYSLRHNVKPGMTGWAQANGFRGDITEPRDMEMRVAHDVWYVNNWSLLLDCAIILKTVWIVLTRQNAH